MRATGRGEASPADGFLCVQIRQRQVEQAEQAERARRIESWEWLDGMIGMAAGDAGGTYILMPDIIDGRSLTDWMFDFPQSISTTTQV